MILSQAEFAARVAPLVAEGLLQAEEVYAVDLCAGRDGERDPDVLLALALAARGPRAGHVGVDLCKLGGLLDIERRPSRRRGDEADNGDDDAATPPWPSDVEAWQQAVLRSPMVGPWQARRVFVSQAQNDGSVLVMPRRMAREQQRVAQGLRGRATMAPSPSWHGATVEAMVARLFGGDAGSEAAAAVRTAASHALTVITGGPGTGKTYSVTRTLALLRELGGPTMRIALAAPTGKAAVRMQEAIAENLQQVPANDGLAVDEAVRADIGALQARTLHTLLGVRPDGGVRHNASNPLDADVVVVDEVSMVDLVLMRMLVEAMAPGARLILLGDRDQLASVEAGTVLSDVVASVLTPAGQAPGPLRPNVVRFTQSRRFATAPTIGAIAAALQQADETAIAKAVAWMCGGAQVAGEPDPERVRWLDDELRQTEASASHSALLDKLAAPYGALLWAAIGDDLARGKAGLAHLANADRQRELLLALEGYRVLATHRAGPRGVEGLVQGLEERARQRLTRALAGQPGPAARLPMAGDHWLGRPLLVTRNDRQLELMNGDVGMVLPAGPEQRLAAIFLDRRGGSAEPVAVPLSHLPPHEGALAMTVHKSQGSQFREVGLVLAEGDSPIQTRELVYTGITRASQRLRWSGTADALKRALQRPVARASGLQALLIDEDDTRTCQ